MGPVGDAVLRRDWHTMSLAGRQSAGLARGFSGRCQAFGRTVSHPHLRSGSGVVGRET